MTEESKDNVRRIPTGIFVEPLEAKQAIQLFGEYHEFKENDEERPKRKEKLNNYLIELAKKYNYENDWLNCEIAPNGEVIRVVKDKEPEGVG